MSAIVSFHLQRFPDRLRGRALVRMGLDRPHLARTPGLRFWRLLGTARGRSMTYAADPSRWAMLGVWDDEADLDRFLATSPVAAFWERAEEHCTLRMEVIQGTGRWAGRELPRPTTRTPTAGDERPEPGDRHGAGTGPAAADASPTGTRFPGPVVALTRASIRLRRLRAFYQSVPTVDRVLLAQPGLLASVGVGEWPLARQGTVSVWRSAEDVRRFAYTPGPHRDVIRRTRDENWYSEELFARMRLLSTQGTWSGAQLPDGSGDLHGQDITRPW